MLCQLSYRGSRVDKVSKDRPIALNRPDLVLSSTQTGLGGLRDTGIRGVDVDVVLHRPADLAVAVRGPAADHGEAGARPGQGDPALQQDARGDPFADELEQPPRVRESELVRRAGLPEK